MSVRCQSCIALVHRTNLVACPATACNSQQQLLGPAAAFMAHCSLSCVRAALHQEVQQTGAQDWLMMSQVFALAALTAARLEACCRAHVHPVHKLHAPCKQF